MRCTKYKYYTKHKLKTTSKNGLNNSIWRVDRARKMLCILYARCMICENRCTISCARHRSRSGEPVVNETSNDIFQSSDDSAVFLYRWRLCSSHKSVLYYPMPLVLIEFDYYVSATIYSIWKPNARIGSMHIIIRTLLI